MKLKAKKVSIGIYSMEGIEIECTLEEMQEMNKHQGVDFGVDFEKQIRDKFSAYPALDLFTRPQVNTQTEICYNGSKRFIILKDKVVILPSENCVTNTDTIKYNETIDGISGQVIGINRSTKEVNILVDNLKNSKNHKNKTIAVMASWLKLIPY